MFPWIGPGRISANRLAEDVGVSQNTLSRWLREASKEKKVKRGNHSKARPVRPEDLSPAEKLQIVMEAANLSEEELGEFLRHRGLHEAQLEEWRKKIEQAALSALGKGKKGKSRKSPEAKRIKELERELLRKDRALAEVTALLALKKKLDSLLGAEDDDTTPRSGR